MIEKYLLIVEGEKGEKCIFENLFKMCGFHVIKSEDKLTKGTEFSVSETYFVNDNKNIVLIEGPANRIHDILVNISKNAEDNIDNIDVELLFGYHSNEFRGVFWIYDVDHNDKSDIERMFNKFSDESGNGLLLLSSPCIEVLAEYDFERELKCNHLREYKSILNTHWNKNGYKHAIDYINKNIKEILLYYLDKNVNDFNDRNVMNHPFEIIEYINKYNIRDNKIKYVHYKYFSSVLYVVLGYVVGLTKEIDNCDAVKSFIEQL